MLLEPARLRRNALGAAISLKDGAMHSGTHAPRLASCSETAGVFLQLLLVEPL